ncbi:hypothetical protein [Microcoleus sp.]|uniref:hypothetical protein n=1 Tax=Microcoleus sp. TaxID=44472 RepID=UPI0035943CAE
MKPAPVENPQTAISPWDFAGFNQGKRLWRALFDGIKALKLEERCRRAGRQAQLARPKSDDETFLERAFCPPLLLNSEMSRYRY